MYMDLIIKFMAFSNIFHQVSTKYWSVNINNSNIFFFLWQFLNIRSMRKKIDQNCKTALSKLFLERPKCFIAQQEHFSFMWQWITLGDKLKWATTELCIFYRKGKNWRRKREFPLVLREPFVDLLCKGGVPKCFIAQIQLKTFLMICFKDPKSKWLP